MHSFLFCINAAEKEHPGNYGVHLPFDSVYSVSMNSCILN